MTSAAGDASPANSEDGRNAFDRFVRSRLHPDFFNGGPDLYRRAKTAVVFALLGTGFAAFFAALNVQFGNPPGAILEGTIAVIAFLVVWNMPKTNNLPLIGNTIALLMTAILLIASWFAGGIDGAALRFLPAVPIMVLLLAGYRSAWAWFGINAAGVLLMFVLDKHGAKLPESFHADEPMHYASVADWWRTWHGLTPLPAAGFAPEKWRELKMSDSIGGMGFGLALASVFEALKDQALRMVEEKNQELASLFDNMRQAIFTFGDDFLVVGQYSGQAKKVFKCEELAGAHVLGLLFKDAPEYDPEFMMFQDWLKVVFSTPAEMWDEMADMVPKERVLNEFTDEEMNLAVEVRPIMSKGKLARIMVLASDETEKVRIAREAAARDAEHNKEMAAMKKLLSGGAQLFIAFMQSATDRLSAFEGDFGAAPREVNANEVEVLFQHAHTVKGEAKAFELADLEEVCHDLEERLTDLREPAKEKGTTSTEPVFEDIVGGIAKAREHIAKVRQQFIDQSPIGALVLEQISVNRGDVEALEQAVQELAAIADASKLSHVTKIAGRLASRPFGEAVGRLQDGIPAWAAQLEKRANFIVEGKDVMIPPGLMKVLPGCLTHMVRNCLAHGIEDPEKREEIGKDPCGSIRVTCMSGSAGPNILVEDDGGGLKIDRLREKAAEMGMSFKPGREWELIFASGMSTTDVVDDISGRGVGMAAVKADIEKAGYELDVHTTTGKGTMFIIRHGGATKRTIPPPAFLA